MILLTVLSLLLYVPGATCARVIGGVGYVDGPQAASEFNWPAHLRVSDTVTVERGHVLV